MKQIIVIGSSNTDMVIKATKLPGPGETILGGDFLMTPGGKGANQAIAAQRLLPKGSEKEDNVIFIAKVGGDLFGEQARRGFEEEGLNTRFVYRDANAPSGVALVGVDEQGENSIMVAPGANANLSVGEVSLALNALPEAEWMLLQLEIPMHTVAHSIRKGAEKGLKVVLNPAPVATIPEDLFSCLYLITPNETEAELLTGVAVSDLASARKAAQTLHHKGVKNVIITLGAKGALLYNVGGEVLIPAPRVKALDTTAAGDVFNGALVVALSEKKPLPVAIKFACQAAAISVTRMGAQASIPQRAEVDNQVGKN